MSKIALSPSWMVSLWRGLMTGSPIYRVGCMAVLLVLAVLALYGQFLWNPILFDDLRFFMVDHEGNQPVSNYHFALLELRSLPYATLAWTKAWFGLELIGFRVGNLLLHTAVVLALFFFLARLFEAVCSAHKHANLSPHRAAFFAALLFALHPVATYAAGYLVQRTIIMATLFCLLAMLAYLHGSIRQKPLWLWVSVPCYYFAVFAKEHAIMLPAVLVALTMLLHGDWRAKLRQRWRLFAALALIAGFVIVAKQGLIGSVYELNAPEMLRMQSSLNTSSSAITDAGIESYYLLSVLTQSWLFFKYLGLWLLPNPAWMSVDIREPFALSYFSLYSLALLAFLLYGFMALRLLLKRGLPGLLGFSLLFPWLMFMTEFSTVRIQESFVLYRSYLWAAGAFCLLPVLFHRLNVRMATLILSIIALAMLPISMDRLMTFSHEMLLWDDAEKLVKGRTDLPGAYRIYYNRGTELIKLNKPDLGIADLKQAIALSKDFAEGHGNLGAAYFKKGDWQNAIVSFSKAIEIYRSSGKSISPRYVYGRAQALEKIGDMQKAYVDYQASCRLGNVGCEKTSPVLTTVIPSQK